LGQEILLTIDVIKNAQQMDFITIVVTGNHLLKALFWHYYYSKYVYFYL